MALSNRVPTGCNPDVSVNSPLAGAAGRHSSQKRIYTVGAPFDRWLAHVAPRLDGCWEWHGARSHGYGRFNTGDGYAQAHRWGYEYFIGLVPDGLELDHLCRRRWCVNPLHLEAVTHRINALRGPSKEIEAHLLGTCVNGHLASEFYRRKSNGRAVFCRACRREQRRADRRAA